MSAEGKSDFGTEKPGIEFREAVEARDLCAWFSQSSRYRIFLCKREIDTQILSIYVPMYVLDDASLSVPFRLSLCLSSESSIYPRYMYLMYGTGPRGSTAYVHMSSNKFAASIAYLTVHYTPHASGRAYPK